MLVSGGSLQPNCGNQVIQCADDGGVQFIKLAGSAGGMVAISRNTF